MLTEAEADVRPVPASPIAAGVLPKASTDALYTGAAWHPYSWPMACSTSILLDSAADHLCEPVSVVQRPFMLQVVDCEPVPCKSCGGILNPYASMDFQAQIWVCPFCHQRNHVPSQYRGISEQSLPAGHAFLPSADLE